MTARSNPPQTRITVFVLAAWTLGIVLDVAWVAQHHWQRVREGTAAS